jgi:DNA repair protein RadA/Sms
LDEPAADLAAILALASSYLDRAIPNDVAAIGEVGLTGELRSVNNLEQRLAEVHRLGFKKCIIPQRRGKTKSALNGLEIIESRNIGEAIRAVFGRS